MKAAAFVAKREVEIVEIEAPAIRKPDDVIVQVVSSGICGSDKGLFLNDGAKPGLHGHEAAGRVVDVGPGVRRWKPSDRVVVYAVIGCGKCTYCLQGQFTYCAERVGGVEGGFCEYLVAPERNLMRMPDYMPFPQACLMSDCFGTPAKAARRVGVGPGDRVAIFGCGPIGLNAIMAATAYGAQVMAVDPVPYRLEAAQRLGAQHVVDAAGDPGRGIHALTGLGADKAMECSGTPEGERQAIACLRPAGRAVFVGECGRLEISPSSDLIRRDIAVMGSWYIHLSDFPENVRLCETTEADPMRAVTHQVPLEDIGEAFRVFCDREDGCLKAIVNIRRD
jgi:propanol-preferring alcohol dehydrogenase